MFHECFITLHRDMLTLKKDQDKFNRGELKELMRKSKDKVELQKMKRVQNKKHIEQSVKERQSVSVTEPLKFVIFFSLNA